MNIKQKIERLTEWLNKQGQWADDYVEHKDNISNYAELFEGHDLHYGEIDSDIQEQVKGILEAMDASDIFDYCDIDVYHGYDCRSNEIWSVNIGEVESQFSGIYDHDSGVNCMYTELCKDLTPNDILIARRDCEYHLSHDCLYIDRTYDRISLVLRVDELLKDKAA